MSKRNAVEYVKQVPKFLQQYQQQYPELTAKTSLHAAADAHDAREEERNAKHRPRDVQLPVVVNMDDFQDELNQPKNALLLAEITTGLDPDQLSAHVEQQKEAADKTLALEPNEPAQESPPPQPTAEELADRERIRAIESEGRHAFRSKQKPPADDGKRPRKKIVKNRQRQVNVLSFDAD